METSASHHDRGGSISCADYSNGISTIKQMSWACRPGCASLTCPCTDLAVLSRQIQEQLFHCATGLPSLPHLPQWCVRASNQVMINISTYCLLTLARRELLLSPVLPQETPPHPNQNSSKQGFAWSKVQAPWLRHRSPRLSNQQTSMQGKHRKSAWSLHRWFALQSKYIFCYGIIPSAPSGSLLHPQNPARGGCS